MAMLGGLFPAVVLNFVSQNLMHFLTSFHYGNEKGVPYIKKSNPKTTYERSSYIAIRVLNF
jgi:hypothetical protein